MLSSTSAHGQVQHGSEAWRGRASAQQANPKARIWSRQQLGYEDSSQAIEADASAVSHQGTDLEGYAGPGQLVSQGPLPEGQQESLPTGARIVGRHPEQGTDTQICTLCQQAHALLLLFASPGRNLAKDHFSKSCWTCFQTCWPARNCTQKIGKVTLGKF